MHFKYALTTLAIVAPVLAGKRIYPKPRIAGRLYGRQQNDKTSLTLASDLIQPGSASTGQEDKVDGQVESLTSQNNFINFCSDFPNVPLTNGEQIFEGSCNGIPSGLIPAKNKMPSSKVLFPKDGDTIEEGVDITFQIKTRGMQTGSFTNAQKTYYSAPTQLNGNGEIIGHNHITVDEITGDDTEPGNPEVFAFFKGLNEPAQNGVLSATAVGGLKAGKYRACTMAADSNHRPIIPAVAQRAMIDDCKRFTVVAKGAGGGNGGAAAGGNGGAAAGGNAGNGAANGGNANNGAANGGNANNGGAAAGGNANNGAAAGGNANNGAAAGGNANNGAANNGNANANNGNANANNGQGRNRNGQNRNGGQQRNGGGRQRQGQKRTNMPQQEMGRRSFTAGGRSRIARD